MKKKKRRLIVFVQFEVFPPYHFFMLYHCNSCMLCCKEIWKLINTQIFEWPRPLNFMSFWLAKVDAFIPRDPMFLQYLAQKLCFRSHATIFIPCSLTTQVFPFYKCTIFFSKVPRGAKCANFFLFRAWMENIKKKVWKKILAKKVKKISLKPQ